MKSLDDVLGWEMEALDGRDRLRVADFVPTERLHLLGLEYTGVEPRVPLEWTRENILAQLREDVAFGFEKALNQRGISSALMYDIVRMWNWVLEEGLEDFDDYPMYGLPVLKATSVKYGWDNPIGDDDGRDGMKYNPDMYYHEDEE